MVVPGFGGEVSMPAHPNIKTQEANQIISYIQSLAESNKQSLPMSGTITPSREEGDNVLVLKATYTDEGSIETPPLTGAKSIAIPGKGLEK